MKFDLKKRIFLVCTVVWLIIIFAITFGDREFVPLFSWLGILPAVIVWGIIWIMGVTIEKKGKKTTIRPSKKKVWNRKKVIILTAIGFGLLMFFPIGLIVNQTKTEKRGRYINITPMAQKSFWDLTLDSTKRDIKFLKGVPTRESNSRWDYESIDLFENKTYSIFFIKDSIQAISFSFYSSSDSPTSLRLSSILEPEIQSIGLLSSYEDLIIQFGKPSNIYQSKDDLTRIFSFEKYNVFFALEKNRVVLLGIYNPVFGPIELENIVNKATEFNFKRKKH